MKKSLIVLIIELILVGAVGLFAFVSSRNDTILSPDLSAWQSRFISFADGKWSVDSDSISTDETIDDDNFIDLIYGPYLSLPRGTYSVSLDYSCDHTQSFEIHSYENDSAIITYEREKMRPDSDTVICHFTLSRPVSDLEVRVHYNGCGELCVRNINVVSSTFLLRRMLVLMVVLFAVIDTTLILRSQRRPQTPVSINANRIEYLDSIKALAIIWVCVCHFIAGFCPQFFELWSTIPFSFVLYGVNAKLAVAVLGVIVCFLAMESSEQNPLKYIVKRYLYFLIAGAVINILYIVTGIYSEPFELWFFIKNTFLLQDSIFPTFWCMRWFFLAGVLAYFNGKYRVGVPLIITQIVCLLITGWDFNWIAVCLMGCLIRPLSKAIDNKRFLKILICIVVFFIIKQEETNMSYYVDGLAATLFVAVVMSSVRMQKAFCCTSYIPRIGKYTMSVFLIHSFVYATVGKDLVHYLDSDSGSVLLLVFMISMLVTGILALFLHELLRCWNGIVSKALHGIDNIT